MAYTKSRSWRYRVTNYTANGKFMEQPDDVSSTFPVYGHTLVGNTLPKWRAIIRSGGNATTTLSITHTDLELRHPDMKANFYWKQTPGPGRFYQRRHRNYTSQGLYSLSPFDHFWTVMTTPFLTKAYDRAKQSLYSTIYQAHHQLQGGVVLGELGKTARMLGSTAKNLKKGVVDYVAKAVGIRRGKGSNSSKRRAIANTYLEATFGWQPLIHDCKDLAKTIGRLCYESDRVRLRGYGQNTGQAVQEVQASNLYSMWVNINRIDTAEFQVVYRGFLRGPRYEAGSPPAERIVSMAGFDLRSFVPTLWELTPYSFLVDYFTNIGDVLQALSTDVSGVHGLWVTEIYESRREINIAPDFARSKVSLTQQYVGPGEYIEGLTFSGSTGQNVIYRKDISRAIVSMPLMVPKFTGFDLPWKQFVNIGALILGKS